jgi:hypothetical protein
MAVKNNKIGGTDWSTPSARIKPTDLNDTIDVLSRAFGTTDNSLSFSYNTDGTVDTITEIIDGETITTTFSYNTDGTVDEVVEEKFSKTITTSMTYSDGVLDSISRTVVDD